MLALILNRQQYSQLSVKERTMYVVRDHLENWFQSLADNAKMKELEAHANKRVKSRKATS